MLGVNEFLSPRADGITHYGITEELCNKYEALERMQFEDISEKERELTLGLFGAKDDIVNCSEEYRLHYTRYSSFNGGHGLSENDIKNTLLPEIYKNKKQFDLATSKISLNFTTLNLKQKKLVG